MRRLVPSALTAIMLGIGLLAPAAHATSVASSNPSPIVAGQPVTITATLGPDHVNFIVIPQGFSVTAWSSNCRIGYQSTRPPIRDEVCSGTFSFTALAPPTPSGSRNYPLYAGYWYGISRNRPSYTPSPLPTPISTASAERCLPPVDY